MILVNFSVMVEVEIEQGLLVNMLSQGIAEPLSFYKNTEIVDKILSQVFDSTQEHSNAKKGNLQVVETKEQFKAKAQCNS